MSQVERTGNYDWAGRIRPIAICVFRRPDGALLLAPGYDKVKGQAFYRPLGGEIEFGELAVDAVRREIREELGCEIEEPRLLGVFENIFTYLGARGHELVWVFESRLIEPSLYEGDSVTAREGGCFRGTLGGATARTANLCRVHQRLHRSGSNDNSSML